MSSVFIFEPTNVSVAYNLTRDGTYWPTGGHAYYKGDYQRPVLYLNIYNQILDFII